MTVQLPPYPAHSGPATARTLARMKEKYLERAAELRAELALAEEQFVVAFQHADARQTARERITALAKTARR